MESALARPPADASLPELRAAAAQCRACPLGDPATQTVFGEGPPDAPLMLVGEMPGDREDLAGRPFVGPAGGVLDRALSAAGIPREGAYLTNAVKHFSFRARGKRRIHRTPEAAEVAACRPWVLAEIEAVAPRVVVALGATAARALAGPQVRVTRDRGRPLPSSLAPVLIVTLHPSAILRIPDRQASEQALRSLTEDLLTASSFVSPSPG